MGVSSQFFTGFSTVYLYNNWHIGCIYGPACDIAIIYQLPISLFHLPGLYILQAILAKLNHRQDWYINFKYI